MAHRVAQALDSSEQVCIEAPTGIGKTFAYLVPAFFHAQRKIRRKQPSVLQAAHMEKRQRDSAVPFHAVHEPLPA